VDALRGQLSSALRIAEQLSGTPEKPESCQQVCERYIRNMLKLRRNRDRIFGKDIFADPAWDILLELYASALGQYRMSVTNLCDGAAVPNTTALRWIKQLEERGLIVRNPDPMDGRRSFLMLSGEGLEAMNAYFRTVPAGSLLI